MVESIKAVRSSSFQRRKLVPEYKKDTLVGPRTNDLPKRPIERGNLIRNIGKISKKRKYE